jgi:transposase
MTQSAPLELSNEQWRAIELHLPMRRGQGAGLAIDNRNFVRVWLWKKETGAAWREVPHEFGNWKSTHRKYLRWKSAGVLDKIEAALSDGLHASLLEIPELSDEQWRVIQPLLPARRGRLASVEGDERLFINAIFWWMETGASWRRLPRKFGNWKSINKRFHRWDRAGLWDKIASVYS